MNDEMNWIDYNGYRYWYQYRPGKDRDICLATKDPEKYCNGFYAYSDKDPGSAMAYVIVKTNHPNPDWNEPPVKSN